MSALPFLPLIFWVLVAGMTAFWHKKNFPIILHDSRAARVSYVELAGAHVISLFGLFALAIGNFSEAYAMIPYALAGIFIVVGTLVKIQGVRSLPDNLWHFTQRNRQLVADGKIVQFHLENDLAALVPLLVLIWLASA